MSFVPKITRRPEGAQGDEGLTQGGKYMRAVGIKQQRFRPDNGV